MKSSIYLTICLFIAVFHSSAYAAEQKTTIVIVGSERYNSLYTAGIVNAYPEASEADLQFIHFHSPLQVANDELLRSKKLLIVAEHDISPPTAKALLDALSTSDLNQQTTWLAFSDNFKNYTWMKNIPIPKNLRFVLAPTEFETKMVSNFFQTPTVKAHMSGGQNGELISTYFDKRAAVQMAFGQLVGESNKKVSVTLAPWSPGMYRVGLSDGLIKLRKDSGQAVSVALIQAYFQSNPTPNGDMPFNFPLSYGGEYRGKTTYSNVMLTKAAPYLSCGDTAPWKDQEVLALKPQGLGLAAPE